jgi:DnaJ-class molecular chaperone
MNHYEVLGVRRNASPRAVRKAYERRLKALAKRPDGTEKAAEERIVKSAFAVISDPAKRGDYDSRLGESDALNVGEASGTPLLIGLIVVAIAAAAIGFFVIERSKERAWMRMEEKRAAAEREKAKQAQPAPKPQQSR